MNILPNPYQEKLAKNLKNFCFSIGPTGGITGFALTSGMYWSGQWQAWRNTEDGYYYLNFVQNDDPSAISLKTKTERKTSIYIEKQPSYTSFCFGNSGDPIFAIEKNGLVNVYQTGGIFSFLGEEPLIYNNMVINQPFTGIELANPIFSSGSILCYYKSGNNLLLSTSSDSYQSHYIVNTGILENKTLISIQHNLHHTINDKDYHPYGLLIFAKSSTGNFIEVLFSKKYTNIGFDDFERYVISGYSSGWGLVHFSPNQINNVYPNSISFIPKIHSNDLESALTGNIFFDHDIQINDLEFTSTGQFLNRTIYKIANAEELTNLQIFSGHWNLLISLYSGNFYNTASTPVINFFRTCWGNEDFSVYSTGYNIIIGSGMYHRSGQHYPKYVSMNVIISSGLF